MFNVELGIYHKRVHIVQGSGAECGSAFFMSDVIDGKHALPSSRHVYLAGLYTKSIHVSVHLCIFRPICIGFGVLPGIPVIAHQWPPDSGIANRSGMAHK